MKLGTEAATVLKIEAGTLSTLELGIEAITLDGT